VFIASRSTTKGAEVTARLNEIQSEGMVQLIEFDLASVESIHRANESTRMHTDDLDTDRLWF